MTGAQQKVRTSGTRPAPTWAFTSCCDEIDLMQVNVDRLVSLIDDTLPRPSTWEELQIAENIAAKIVRHLTLFEGAWFSRKRVEGWLYGLELGGVSTSSSTSRYILLRQWQKVARLRIGALS